MKPYYEAAGITIYHGDCREILPQLPKVNAVITDPPYGCAKAEWDDVFPAGWYPLLNTQLVAIITGSAGLKDSIKTVGTDYIDVIAARNLNGMTRGPLGFGNWLAAVIAKGKPRQGPNTFDFCVTDKMPNHPSPKPYEYMRMIVERLTEVGHTILDPFMGSGTTLLAAKNLGRESIGIEINERYCEIAAKRVCQDVLDFSVRKGPQPATIPLFNQEIAV